MKKFLDNFIHIFLAIFFISYAGFTVYYVLSIAGWNGWFMIASILGVAVIWKPNESVMLVRDLSEMLPDLFSDIAKLLGILILVALAITTIFAILTIVGHYTGPWCTFGDDCL